jgi:hypothetical protein
MSPAQLNEMFASSPAGTIPVGRGRGTVVVVPGTRFTGPLAAVARGVLWQGKVFRPGTHDLVNLISPFSRQVLRAEVREDRSAFDGRPCIVLDYSRSSKAARKVRDEIRQIGPGEYLGVVYNDGRKLNVFFLLKFALTSQPTSQPTGSSEGPVDNRNDGSQP